MYHKLSFSVYFSEWIWKVYFKLYHNFNAMQTNRNISVVGFDSFTHKKGPFNTPINTKYRLNLMKSNKTQLDIQINDPMNHNQVWTYDFFTLLNSVRSYWQHNRKLLKSRASVQCTQPNETFLFFLFGKWETKKKQEFRIRRLIDVVFVWDLYLINLIAWERKERNSIWARFDGASLFVTIDYWGAV